MHAENNFYLMASLYELLRHRSIATSDRIRYALTHYYGLVNDVIRISVQKPDGEWAIYYELFCSDGILYLDHDRPQYPTWSGGHINLTLRKYDIANPKFTDQLNADLDILYANPPKFGEAFPSPSEALPLEEPSDTAKVL